MKGRNCKHNFNKRIIITVSVLLIRATMKVTSNTLPIWSTQRAWKLLGHLLVIAVLMLWWWTWRVEGLIILHLLLLIVVVLMSLVGKLG
jgi:cell division protein FtsW (lipid II flippase)